MPPSIKSAGTSSTKTQSQTTTSLQLILAIALLAISGSAAFVTAPSINVSSNLTCKDTDGGNMPNVFGEIVITNKLTNVRKTVAADTCISDLIISETICNAKEKSGHSTAPSKCSNGTCQKGVCVPTKVAPPLPVTSFNFLKHPSSTPITVLPSMSNVILGRFIARSTGAEVILGEIGLSFVVNKPNLLYGNYVVKLNGTPISTDAVTRIANSGSQLTTITLTTQRALPIGDNTITVEASIGSSAMNGGVILTYLDLSKIKQVGAGQMYYDPGVQSLSSDAVTVQTGALQVTTLPSPPAQTVEVGTSNVTLAMFELNAGTVSSGDDVKVTKLIFTDKLGGTAAFTNIRNLVLLDQSGNPLATSAATTVNSAATTFTLVNPLIVPKTGSLTLTLKGDVVGGTNGTHTFSISSVANVKAQEKSTGNLISPVLGTGAGQMITLKVTPPPVAGAGALRVTTLSTPPAQTVAINSTNVVLAMIELNALAVSSGEDVRISKVVVNDKLTGAAQFSDIGNLVIYDPNGNPLLTTGNTAMNSATTAFTFVTPLAVPKSGSITLTLKADIIGGVGGTHTFSASSQSSDMVAVGKVSGNTIIPTFGTGTGQPITIDNSSPNLAFSLVSGSNASPSLSQNVILDQKNVPVFAFKMTALTEPIKLTSLKLTAAGKISPYDFVNIRLYRNNETTPFASASQLSPCTSSGCSFTWLATDNLLPNPIQLGAPVTVYVKADIGPVGAAALGDSVVFSLTDATSVSAKGTVSGINANAQGLPIRSAGTLFINPFSVTMSPDYPSSGSSQTLAIINNSPIARFKITNNGTAKISLERIAFTDLGTHTGNTTLYSLKYSHQNSSNSPVNTAIASNNDGLNFNLPEDKITIDGGAYRYITVSIANIGGAVSEDAWQLSIKPIDNVWFSALEADLGYDANGSGTLSGKTTHLYPDGGNQMVGAIVKQ